VSPDALERDVLTLSGTDRYDVVSYRLVERPPDVGLALTLRPRSYGPPFLLPGFDLRNTDSTTFAANLRARLAVYDTFVAGSEVRFDAGVGTQETVGLELYRRVRPSPLFVAPRAYFQRSSVNAYDGQVLIAEYRQRRTGAGLDVGLDAGSRNEVRVGFDVADVRVERRIGDPVLPEATGTERVASLRWTFDGQDGPVVPTRGAHVQAAFRRYLATPDLVTARGREPGPKGLMQAEARASVFHTWRGRERGFVLLGAGTSFSERAGIDPFRLGGPLRLGGYNADAIAGDHYLLGVAGVLHEVFRLPDVVGGRAYVGAWIENGSAFDAWKSAKYRGSVSTGFVVETLFGPLFFGGSANFEGSSRFYVVIGSVIR
jgi:NTE family protein